METIKVNMSPNPLDVQTIHASQNDGEARQWEFELHNNGELIDTSEVTEQMFFKAYKGGTEEILPTNGSVPTTAPFLGDIRYPQGLLTDQEFTYRQSPTESDGLAKITDIKGNTLVWNQLVENGDFSTSNGWSGQFATVTISNNVASVRQDRAGDYVALRKSNLQGLTGHKYLVVADVKSAKKTAIAFYLSNAYSSAYDIQANTRTVVHTIITVSNANNSGFNVYTNRKVELAEGDVVEFYHVMLFDLTQMGLDISSPSDFTSLFPLSYYSYNQGSLLSFNGNGIKTTGKNLFTGAESYSRTEAGYYIREGTGNSPLPLKLAKGTYTISIKSTVGGRSQLELFSGGMTSADRIISPYVSLVVGVKTYTFTIDKQCDYIRLYGNFVGTISNIQIEAGSTATDYEPYVEHALSIPLDEFPNGMDGINDARDEKNETWYVKRIGTIVLNGSELWHSPDSSGNCWINLYAMKRSLDYRETMKSNIAVSQSCRAMNTTEVSVSGYPSEQSDGTNWLYIMLPNQDQTIANITAYLQEHPVTVEFELYNPLENYGVVDMGSLNWSRRNDVNGAFFTKIDDMALGVANKLSNLLCPLYATRNTAYYGQLSSFTNMEIAQGNATQGEVYLVNTSYNDVATFKQAMSGVYLLYEKENPQGFTTASLVTENAEIPLSNEDGVLIGKCTEQLSENPGFIDAKIKLSDSDGTCYSNKLQLHVERSPQ